ncbi:MAG: EAL domain-containing protein, partial [Firmicutes bacterium]|nr:EAL domain-containing protein [Bacillota bacterium]
WVLFAFVMIMLALNFVRPVLFCYDASGRYIPGIARDITLIVQIAMFAVIAVHVFMVASNAHGTMKTRCRAIGLFSIAMALFVGLQFCFPLLPMYAIGCMLGCCLLYTFVQENEKEEYRESLEYELQQNIEKGNYYDLLTGLPGMTYFFGIAEEKRRDFIVQGITPAFVFIDLSGMKLYNLKHGFAEGDKLLQNLSKVIVMEFGEDSCSRFAQDHFAVIAKEFGLKERLERMFKVWETSGFEETLPIRAGIYVDNMDKVDVPTACDRAKTACDTIRDRYVSSLYYFDRELLIAAEKKHYVITHIDQALKEKWVKIYYQPIIRVSNGSVCSEEALARWDDPERGFMTPGDFIPALEDGRLIYKLDLYVLDRVLEKLKCLQDAGKDMVPQSINLSRIDFEVCDIAGEISRRVDDMGIPHEYIVIEITESTIGSNFEFIKEQIERFRSMGFSVWMDDFGSGYSTLDMLSKIKVDLIKFDMRFIQQFESSETNKIVINELIKLAMALGIDTLCEGVETKQQADFLRYSGCTRLQGFYYAVPLPVEQLFEIYADDKEMGLENLDESDYYEQIGKINLYDLSVITREDSGSFRNYFNTIPMAVIEVNGNRTRFT